MSNLFDDTQAYIVSDLEQPISSKSSNSASNTASVPQKRSYTSDCMSSLLNISSPIQQLNNTQSASIDEGIRSATCADDPSNNLHLSQKSASPRLSNSFGMTHNSRYSSYDTDHSHDPYTSDSWSSQHEEDSLSDLYDNEEDNKYGSAADPIHYIPIAPRRKLTRKQSMAPTVQQQELDQSPIISSRIISDDSDSDSDGFGTPSSSPLPPQPLNFIQRYHQQQQQQQRELNHQDIQTIKSETVSTDCGDSTVPYDATEENSDHLDKNIPHDNAIIFDRNDLYESNQECHIEQPSTQISTSNDWQLVLQNSDGDDSFGDCRLGEKSRINDNRSYSDCVVLDTQPGNYYPVDGVFATGTFESENDDQADDKHTLSPLDDTQRYNCRSDQQTHNEGLSFDPSTSTSTETIEMHENDNTLITNTHSQQRLQQSSLDLFFSQLDTVSSLSSAKSYSEFDDSDKESDTTATLAAITTAISQDSSTSHNGSVKISGQSSLDHLRVEKVKTRLTQSPKDEQHWLTSPSNLPLSHHSKPYKSPPRACKTSPEFLTSKPRRRLPGLPKPKDPSSLSSSVSAPSIATMLSTREQHSNEVNLRPTNIIVKSSSSLSISPRKKKTLGMSRYRIY